MNQESAHLCSFLVRLVSSELFDIASQSRTTCDRDTMIPFLYALVACGRRHIIVGDRHTIWYQPEVEAMLLQGGRGTWFHVVVGVIGSVQQCHLQVSECGCGCCRLPVVVVWVVETLSLCLNGPATIVWWLGHRRRASCYGCLMKPGKRLTRGGCCREVSCWCGCSCEVIGGSNIPTRCSTTAE